MKFLYKLLALTGIGALWGMGNKTALAQSAQTSHPENVRFEDKLKVFSTLGFVYDEGVVKQDIVDTWGKERLEHITYSQLYITLGSELHREPWTPITNQCWYFDTEAIDGEGAYVAIIQNLARISNGELPFENISDVVDWDRQQASVSFDLKGDRYSWELVFDEDWVDTDLFVKIVALTRQYNTRGRFTFYDLGGQDVVIGWATPEKLEEINATTGLGIVWLE
ncbi:MAG: hypothetical protein SF053_01875 [Bacteroidia bacterium]|nr:hypothetical protein [Bacteroidia bacterium]